MTLQKLSLTDIVLGILSSTIILAALAWFYSIASTKIETLPEVPWGLFQSIPIVVLIGIVLVSVFAVIKPRKEVSV